jgi:hypothetical protein
MSKILRREKLRKKYDYWLENGIPYWRGQKYYFRKSENLSVVQSVLVVLLGFSLMQYVAMWVRYIQVRSGLSLLARQRDVLAVSRTTQLSSKQAKQLKKAERKKKNGLEEESPMQQAFGLFDDANMKLAMDFLVLQHGIPPEIVMNKKEWQAMVEEEFDSDEGILSARIPMPWSTFLIAGPMSLIGMLFKRSKPEEHEHDE